MAKLKRQVLKEIMKEILVEIMMEGLDSEGELLESKRSVPSQRAQPRQRQRRQPEQSTEQPILRENVVEHAVREVSDDPMMMDILRDTAQTTLTEQKEGRVVGDSFQQAASQMDPMDVMPNSQNWAQLAFGDVKNK